MRTLYDLKKLASSRTAILLLDWKWRRYYWGHLWFLGIFHFSLLFLRDMRIFSGSNKICLMLALLLIISLRLTKFYIRIQFSSRLRWKDLWRFWHQADFLFDWLWLFKEFRVLTVLRFTVIEIFVILISTVYLIERVLLKTLVELLFLLRFDWVLVNNVHNWHLIDDLIKTDLGWLLKIFAVEFETFKRCRYVFKWTFIDGYLLLSIVTWFFLFLRWTFCSLFIKLIKVLLCMRPSLSASSSSNVLVYLVPVLAVNPQSLQKPFMFFICPSPSVAVLIQIICHLNIASIFIITHLLTFLYSLKRLFKYLAEIFFLILRVLQIATCH